MLKPGDTIGILGGGQLGRMLAIEAARLGLRAHVYTPEADSVAAELAHDATIAPWDDARAVARFADACDIVTWEFENVPVGPLAAIEGKLAPHPRALETAQDRLNEKRFVEGLGGLPAPYAPVDNAADLTEAIDRIGAPGILKTRRDGYDGKGQWRIASAADADALGLPDRALIYEGLVEFEAEFSVILARSSTGEIRFWDSTHNEHRGGILARSSLPAPACVAAHLQDARDLSAQVADALDYIGVLTLEFFATEAGAVFNEMAPRVHNSGHWTIEGAATCQFANHIRAVAGLPLGDTVSTADEVEMLNLLGDDVASAFGRLSDPAATLHLYGKRDARTGRKMGHVTRIMRK